MKLFVIIIILKLTVIGQLSAQKLLPPILKEGKEITSFVPQDWKIIESDKADLNKDSLEDVVLLIQGARFDSINMVNDPAWKVLIILFKTISGYKVSSIGYNAIACSTCGGIDKDNPFLGVTVDAKKQSIYIQHFIRSAMSCSFTHQFRFQKGDWYLIGQESAYTGHYVFCKIKGKQESTLTGKWLSENFIAGIINETNINEECEKTVNKKKVAPKPLVKLSDFVMDSYSEIEP